MKKHIHRWEVFKVLEDWFMGLYLVVYICDECGQEIYSTMTIVDKNKEI
jgi:hypothetical protein